MSQVIRAAVVAIIIVGFGCESPATLATRQAALPVDGGPCDWAPTALPEPHELDQPLPHVSPSAHASYECGGAPPIDGHGDVAVAVSGPRSTTVSVLSPDGGYLEGWGPAGVLTAMKDGFLIVDCTEYDGDQYGSLSVERWWPGESLRWSGATFDTCHAVPDVSGGATTLSADWPPHMGSHVRIRRFDERAQLTATIELFHSTPPCASWAATDANGDTLAIYGVPPACGEVIQWFDAEGDPLTSPSSTQDPRAGDLSTARFQPLIGGGFAVAKDGAWVGVLGSGDTETSDPPEWLRALRGVSLELAPGRAGYLVHGAVDAGPDAERVLLVGENGESCGSLDVPVAPGAWTVGADGSIATEEQRPTDGGVACGITIWPSVFR